MASEPTPQSLNTPTNRNTEPRSALLERLGIPTPDAIACFCGGIKQPVEEKDTATGEPTGKLLAPLHDRDVNYGPTSFTLGEDPHQHDAFGMGGKTNTLAAAQMLEAMGSKETPVITFASFSNPLEKRAMAQAEEPMPSDAAVYTNYLKHLGVENPIIECDQEWVNNTFTTLVALVEQMAAHPEWHNVSITTVSYNITRVKAFMEAMGLQDPTVNLEDCRWIFDNFQRKKGGPMIFDQFAEAMKTIRERGDLPKIQITGSEQLLKEVDRIRVEEGKHPHYSAVLDYVYPPLTQAQFNKFPPIVQEIARDTGIQIVQDDSEIPAANAKDLDIRRDLLIKRITAEAGGIENCRNKTYWA